MEAFLQLISIHAALCWLLFLPALLNICVLIFSTNHTTRLKTLSFVAPAYYSLLAACGFSGAVAWAVLGFEFSLKVCLMFAVWCVILALEIRRHVAQKKIMREINAQIREQFFTRARVRYAIDFALLALLLLWGI